VPIIKTCNTLCWSCIKLVFKIRSHGTIELTQWGPLFFVRIFQNKKYEGGSMEIWGRKGWSHKFVENKLTFGTQFFKFIFEFPFFQFPNSSTDLARESPDGSLFRWQYAFYASRRPLKIKVSKLRFINASYSKWRLENNMSSLLFWKKQKKKKRG